VYTQTGHFLIYVLNQILGSLFPIFDCLLILMYLLNMLFIYEFLQVFVSSSSSCSNTADQEDDSNISLFEQSLAADTVAHLEAAAAAAI
jgi:hypothetical protein